MIDIFIFAIKVVFPIFILIVFGYILKKGNIINDGFIKVANKLCYKLLIPFMVFKTIFESDLKNGIDLKFVGIAATGLIVYIILTVTIINLTIKKEKRIRGSLAQAIFRSNFALFGIPLVTNMFIDSAAVGITAILLAFIVPIFNIAAVIVLSIYGGSEVSFKRISLGIIKNPIIIATICGLICNFVDIKLGFIVKKPVWDLANMAAPLALIALGGNFKFEELKNNIHVIIYGNVGKLLVMPLIFLALMISFGYRDHHLGAIVAMTATPVAISSYAMASESNCDGDLAGNMILTSTVFSAASLILILSILKAFHFI